jgi:primosomal protein N'
MKAPVFRIKERFRYQILMRITGETDKLTDMVYDAVDACTAKNVSAYVEINPSSMF